MSWADLISHPKWHLLICSSSSRHGCSSGCRKPLGSILGTWGMQSCPLGKHRPNPRGQGWHKTAPGVHGQVGMIAHPSVLISKWDPPAVGLCLKPCCSWWGLWVLSPSGISAASVGAAPIPGSVYKSCRCFLTSIFLARTMPALTSSLVLSQRL